MNERIFKLALQADIIQWDSLPWSGARTPDHESVVKARKFAELIINECADIAMREDHDPAECIKQHFGVMNNIKAGADMNAGDGGYSESTKERYEEAVKGRKVIL